MSKTHDILKLDQVKRHFVTVNNHISVTTEDWKVANDKKNRTSVCNWIVSQHDPKLVDAIFQMFTCRACASVCDFRLLERIELVRGWKEDGLCSICSNRRTGYGTRIYQVEESRRIQRR